MVRESSSRFGITPGSYEISLIRLEVVREAASAHGLPEYIDTPSDVLPLLGRIKNSDRETFVCIHLSSRNQVNALEVVSIGHLNTTVVHPREVFKAAILSNSASLILAHNHPSGSPDPSDDDQELTKRMVEAGKLIGIEVLDHLIVSASSYFSMKEMGMM